MPHSSLLAKSEEDSPSMSGVSVGDSGISAKSKGRDTIPSGMSVHDSTLLVKKDACSDSVSVAHSGTSAKIEEDSPSMSGLSVVNPNPFPKNKDRIERQTRARALCKTMGLNLGVSQRWQHWQPMNRALL